MLPTEERSQNFSRLGGHMTSSSNNTPANAVRRAARIGGAAVITVVGGTVFVGGQPASAATFTVTNLNESGPGSLFQAVLDANAAGGADTIVFAPGLSGELDIGPTTLGVNDDLTIAGPGTTTLTLTNQDASDVIYLYGGASLTISDLTIDDAAGNAIRANLAGDIIATDVAIIDSFADGIEVYRSGDVTVTDSLISRSGSHGIYLYGSGDATLTGTTLSANGSDGLRARNSLSLNATRVTGFSNDGSTFDISKGIGDVTVISSDFHFDQEESIYVYDLDVGAPGTGNVTVTDTTARFVDQLIVVKEVEGDVVLEDITVDSTTDDAIELTQIDGDLTVRDATILNSYDDAIYVSSVGEPGNPSEVLFERVTIDLASDSGIDANTIVGNATARDITVTDALYAGGVEIDDVDADGGIGGNIVIERVSVSGSDAAIDVEGEGTITVTDVTGLNLRGDGVQANAGGDITLDRVTADRVSSGGIDLYSSNGGVTVTNTTTTFADDGIEIGAELDVRVSDVTVSGVLDNDGLDLRSNTGSIVVERVDISQTNADGIHVYAAGGDVTIRDVTVSEAQKDGIDVNDVGGITTIERVTIDETGLDGLDFDNTGQVMIRDVQISNVDSDGIHFYDTGAIEIEDVDISDPDSTGVDIDNSSASTISGLTVSGANGSGLSLENSGPTVMRNSTITDNATDGYAPGAGIDLFNSDITIVGSTITDNSGPASGAAIFRTNASAATVTASIVAANDGLDPFGDDATGALTVNNTLVDTGTGLGGTTIETSDAMLGELQDNGGPTRTVKPAPGSPAIDAVIVPVGPGVVDQRGVARPVGPAADLGSVEVSAGSVEFDPAAVTVDEDAGTVDLTLVRTGGRDGDATVDFATAPGTATAGTDFTAVSDTVILPDNAGSVIVTVPIINDTLGEPAETFSATISSPTVVTVGTADTATVTITDTDVSDVITALSPARFADTRPTGETFDDIAEKTGKLAAGEQIMVQIGGRGGVPADAVGVVINITAIQAESNGFITSHPCLTPRPNTSSLNYTAGVTIANEVVASLDSSGKVCLFSSAAVNLAVDVVGYVSANSPLTPVTPARLVDTRSTGSTVDDQNEGEGRTTAGGSKTIRIAGRAGVPSDAAAAILNVTAVRATQRGFITVHACVDPAPTASSLNFTPGVNRGNELVASLDSSGDICIFTSADIDLTVDVVAYIPAGTSFSSVTPARLFDSRPGETSVDGQAARTTKLAANQEVTLSITGRAGIPATAKAAIINITAVAADGRGFITAHPCVNPRPLASSLNYVPGINGGNEIIASLDSNGDICLFTSATTHLTVDVVGYLE
jgi:parallel beta-helix repeat protein